jgi:hypothetical protein
MIWWVRHLHDVRNGCCIQSSSMCPENVMFAKVLRPRMSEEQSKINQKKFCSWSSHGHGHALKGNAIFICEWLAGFRQK